MTMNYDPNITISGRMANQTVRLTFGLWEARKTMETNVGGNCTGLDVIDCAITHAYQMLPTQKALDYEFAYIELEKPNGDTLRCEDDYDGGERWLKDMLVGAEIIAIAAENDIEA